MCFGTFGRPQHPPCWEHFTLWRSSTEQLCPCSAEGVMGKGCRAPTSVPEHHHVWTQWPGRPFPTQIILWSAQWNKKTLFVHLSSLFTWCNLYFYYVGCLCFGTGCPVKLCLPQPWLLSQEKDFYFLTFLKLSILLKLSVVSITAFLTSFKPPFVIAWLGLADGFTQNSIWWQTWCVCGYCCDSYN